VYIMVRVNVKLAHLIGLTPRWAMKVSTLREKTSS
jgi:hypothetical protein